MERKSLISILTTILGSLLTWLGSNRSGGTQPAERTKPSRGNDMHAKPLLDFIGRYEAGRLGYNSVWNGIEERDRPKDLTAMTIHDVLAWQDSIDAKYNSEAAGRYQIMEDTLRGLYLPAGLSLNDKFDERGQDQLAIALLRRRGLHEFLIGNWSVDMFCNSIAKEWASMPVVTDVRRGKRIIRKGQSYYAGDGLNKAHADVEEFRSCVRDLRN